MSCHSSACAVRSRRASLRSLEDTSRSCTAVALAAVAAWHRSALIQVFTWAAVTVGSCHLSQVFAGGHHQVGSTTNQLEIVQKIC